MELITGNKFKKICNYSLDEFGFNIIKEPEINEVIKFFVKVDYIHSFFSNKKEAPYILITHNGDIPIDAGYLNYLNDPKLIKWYAQNVNLIHPKLVSIPIGIANEKWPHGDEAIFFEVINSDIKKERLIYVNFDVNTNRGERNYCISELNKKGLTVNDKLPFKGYLQELAKSYFVVSPNGNGIDCHKTWEALYVKTIPVVTKSINIDFYKNFPIVIINDWSEFDPAKFTIEEYNKIWNNFDLKRLNIYSFI